MQSSRPSSRDRAGPADEIELIFAARGEPLIAAPTVLFGDNVPAATVQSDASKNQWTAKISANNLPEGPVSFIISNYQDEASNVGAAVLATSDDSGVVVGTWAKLLD